MRGREWFDADAVVISDFIAQRLPDDVVTGSCSVFTSTSIPRGGDVGARQTRHHAHFRSYLAL